MCMMSANCDKPNRRLQNGEERPCSSCSNNLSSWVRKLALDPQAVSKRAKNLRKWQDRMMEVASTPRGKRYAKRIQKAFK